MVDDENLAVPEAKSYSYCSAYAMKIMENFPFHLFETSPNQNQHPSKKKKNENSDCTIDYGLFELKSYV